MDSQGTAGSLGAANPDLGFPAQALLSWGSEQVSEDGFGYVPTLRV